MEGCNRAVLVFSWSTSIQRVGLSLLLEQQFLADKLNVQQEQRSLLLNHLEAKNSVVRIPVAGNVCAYALDPHEV